MVSRCRFHIAVQLVLCQVINQMSAQQCVGEYSIHGMMLKQHTFETLKTSISLDCLQACHNDVKCQSFNYVISKDVCELNNRTKEARPEDLVPDADRFYYGRVRKRGKMPLVSDIVKKNPHSNNDTKNKTNKQEGSEPGIDLVRVTIGHFHINILTWHRGFQDILLCLVAFPLYPSLFGESRDKGNLKKYIDLNPKALQPCWNIDISNAADCFQSFGRLFYH